MTAAFKKVSKKTPVEQFMSKIQATAGTNGLVGQLARAVVPVPWGDGQPVTVDEWAADHETDIINAIKKYNSGIDIMSAKVQNTGGLVSPQLTSTTQSAPRTISVILKDGKHKTCEVEFVRGVK